MISEELEAIIDKLKEQGKMIFLEGATEEQITQFEKDHEIEFPEKYKEWLQYSDGGELFLPAGVQFYGVAHKPIIDVDENDIGDGCLLRDIYKKSGVRKQTINSAIRSLEAAGILHLEQHIGRTKKIILTEKGNAFVQKTAAKIYQAEIQAFDTWSEDEISSYIHLMKKYHDCLRRQIDQL